MFAGSVQAAAGCHGLIKPNYRCHKPELAPTRLGSPASPSADTATPHCPPPLQPAVRLTKWEMKNPINILRGPAIPADSPRQVKGFTAWRELLVSLRMHIYGSRTEDVGDGARPSVSQAPALGGRGSAAVAARLVLACCRARGCPACRIIFIYGAGAGTTQSGPVSYSSYAGRLTTRWFCRRGRVVREARG